MTNKTAPTFFVHSCLLMLICGICTPELSGDIAVIGASKDNSMFENNPLNSNGAGSFFFAGRTGPLNNNALQRGLIAFDVAGSVPGGATIDSVSLSLHLSRSVSGDQPVSLHLLQQDWGEGTSSSDGPNPGVGAPATAGDATWQHTFFPGSTWTNPGGDFNAVASATQTVGLTLTNYNWSSAGMVADVQSWLDNPANNFGWAVLGNESGPTRVAKRFDSRNSATAAFRPSLTINFTPIPEPSTGLLGTVITMGLCCFGRKRRRM